jgi:hypothetical protein
MEGQIKGDEMGRAYGGYEGKKIHTEFRWGNLKESEWLEDLDIDGRITLTFIFMLKDEELWRGGWWEAQVRDQWQNLVNTVMNLK